MRPHLDAGRARPADPRLSLRARMEGQRLESAPVEAELRRIAQDRLAQTKPKRR